MLNSGSSSALNHLRQALQGQTDKEQIKLIEFAARLRAMTFEDFAIPSLGEKVHSKNAEDLYYGLFGLKVLLSRKVGIPFQRVIDINMIPRLIQIINETSFADHMKFQAAWCLTYLCVGRIKQVQYCVDRGVIQAFLSLLKIEDPEVVLISISGLGFIARSMIKFRKLILKHNGEEILMEVLKKSSNKCVKYSGFSTLLNLCTEEPFPKFSLLSKIVSFLSDFFKNEKDPEILFAIARGLYNVSFHNRGCEMIVSQNVIPNVIQNLSNNNMTFVSHCLGILRNLLFEDEDKAFAVLKEKDFLPKLFMLTNSSMKDIREDVFFMASIIVKFSLIELESIMGNATYVEKIIHAAKNDEHEVVLSAVCVLFNSTTDCISAQIRRTLDNGVFTCLVDILSQEGNQAILDSVLGAIANCLKGGRLFDLNDENGENKFVVKLRSKGAIDLLEKLKNNPDFNRSLEYIKDIEKYLSDDDKEKEKLYLEREKYKNKLIYQDSFSFVALHAFT